MASGTVWGSFTAKATNIARPYVNWSQTQNVAANTSTITATLIFVRYDGYNSNNGYGPTFTLNIDGVGVSESHNFSIGPNGVTTTVMTYTRTVNHNADGTKSITIAASGDTGLSSLGNVNLSGTVTLDTIPRASTFTITGNTIGSPITVDIQRADSSFTHNVWYDLPVGTNRAGWVAATQQIFTPDLSDCQYITNGSSGTAKIRVETYSGSTYIGVTEQQFTLYVPSSVVPTASGLTVAINGTGRDKTLGMYIQSMSKVDASFTSSGIYGSTITSNVITIQRQSDNGNSQTINGTSGTTANPLALDGTYIITATATDSRGRTATVSTTITVTAYSLPTITTFTTARDTSITSNVNASLNLSWSMAANNPATVTVVGVKGSDSSSATLYTLSNSTAGLVNTTQQYTNQSDASAYTYTLTVTDSFGNKATATATIGTSFAEFTIAKGHGVGIGKVWAQGALDVGGDAYVSGILNTTGLKANGLDLTAYNTLPSGDGSLAYWHGIKQGTYFCGPNTITGQPQQWGLIDKIGNATDFTLMWFTQSSGPIYRVSGNSSTISPWILIPSYNPSDINSILDVKSSANFSYQNGWVDYSPALGGSYDNGGWVKYVNGQVQFKGLVADGAGSGTIAQLPVGCRPWGQRIFACLTATGGIGRIDVSSDGYITNNSGVGPNNGWIDLSCISYRAER